MGIRLMVVEDEGLFRDMLRLSLGSQPNVEVVGTVGDGASAIKMARELSPDVVLMDIELGPGPNGVEAGLRIRQTNPRVGIVLLSMHREKEFLSAIPQERAGGWSYVLKQSIADLGALMRAVEGSAAGLMVLDPGLMAGLQPKPNSKLGSLTTRQREVMELMAQGYNNVAIAQHLHLEEKSVQNYVNGVYQHLDINSDETAHPRVKAVLLYLHESYGR